MDVKNNIRTDLACEILSDLPLPSGGISYSEENINGFFVSETRVLTDEASAAIGKGKGRYITVGCGRFSEMDDSEAECLSVLISKKLGEAVDESCKKPRDTNFCVLVSGLGNASMTADSIGPEVACRLTVTNHLAELDTALHKEIGCC